MKPPSVRLLLAAPGTALLPALILAMAIYRIDARASLSA
jgi:hypothetical protein